MKSVGFVIEESVKALPLSDYTAPCLPDAPEQEEWLEEAMLRRGERMFAIL